MTAATAAERQRRHRGRVRAERARAWSAEYPALWHPFLAAWAARGLQRPPSDAQLQLLRPYAERERGPGQLGAVLRRCKRARARHSHTTYRLVAAVVRALEQVRQLAQDARDAFSRPLGLSDPNARRERGERELGAERPPPRTSRKSSPGQDTALPFAERMRLAGLDPKILERFTRKGS